MDGDHPSPGDVLIVPDSVSGHGYALSTAPNGPSQLWYASYELAVQQALEWPSVSGASVWRANGPARFERVQTKES